MKLDKTGVDPFLWESLVKMQSDPLFEDYYLVGGTALSLQIGHRISEDIDLFTKDNKNEAIPNSSSKCNKDLVRRVEA